MRSYEEYKRILRLWEQGHNKVQIAKQTGIPRGTVRDTINKYGSVEGLEIHSENASNIENYDTAKRILELWEQGHSKVQIAEMTSITRYRVTNCIERYRSIAQLDEITQHGRITAVDFSPKAHPIVDKIRKPNRSYTDEDLVKAIHESHSLADTLRKLGLRPAGGNYTLLKRKIEELELDTSHFRGQGWSKGKKQTHVTRQSLDKILIENSTYKNSNSLRKRLINEGVFEHVCVNCELDTWLDQPIPLELDHINGNNRDNRLENLRLLCPNCHALTATYRGKNIVLEA